MSAIVAAHDEIVDGAVLRAQQAVVEADARRLASHAQRGRAPRALGLGALCSGQFAAGSGISALGQRPMRRRGCFADLGARAVAGIQPSVGVEARERLVVELQALGLTDDRPVPVQPECGQVCELRRGHARPHPPVVEVLDAQQQPCALRAREQPRQQRGAQAAEMKRARRRRGVAAGGVQRAREANRVPPEA